MPYVWLPPWNARVAVHADVFCAELSLWVAEGAFVKPKA